MKKMISLILVIPTCLFSQARYDIIISEIMPDPIPSVGLPNHEWIELKNVSTTSVNLLNWRIADATGQSGPMPAFLLQPDSFVVICANNAVGLLSPFGSTISVSSFPSLDNNEDIIILRSNSGMTMHAVSYSSAWYGNELKSEGGWSLEIIDPAGPCEVANNWKASEHSMGGSPARKNSVDNVNNAEGPVLHRTYTIDDSTIIAVFDKPVDSFSASVASNFHINNGLTITRAVPQAPLFNLVRLTLDGQLEFQKTYDLSTMHIKGCRNSGDAPNNKVLAGLPEELNSADIVINEILFNPRANADDFVELYNKSNKIFDASKIYIANRNSSNAIGSVRQLSVSPLLIFPGEFLVATADEVGLGREYLVRNHQWVVSISSPPSMPDDDGYIILLNQQGEVVDEVHYSKDWHFKLLTNLEGVTLERIDPNGSSGEPSNWHSAASTSGYGTPTDKNSQYKQVNSVYASIEITPPIFSPDNDGRDDIATIQYKTIEPGYVANITIFDAIGRPVRSLVRNGLLGLEGYWNWDGLGDKGQQLAVGIYVVLTELFNLNGKKERFKSVVTLGRKL